MLECHVRALILPTTSVFTGFALILTLAAPASTQHAWTPISLGPPGIQSGATGVNAAGQVVGYFISSDGTARAALWTAAGDIENLATVGNQTSVATAINSAGEVVGNSQKLEHYLDYYDYYASDGFRWTAAEGMIDVSDDATIVPPSIYGAGGGAADMNDAGQIAVYIHRCFIEFEVCVTWALVRASANSYLSIDNLLGGRYTTPAGINEAGEVVGSATTAGGQTHAFLWTAAGGMIDVGTLGGSSSEALGINDAGQVVGSSATAGGQTHAFLWTTSGGMVDLGTLGGPSSRASAINNAGQIVGGATATGSTREHAFVWTSANGMQRLPDPTVPDGCIASWAWATGLNATGTIVGTGGCDTANQHAILWRAQRHHPSPSLE
jgi:probable HAF family extracellular repeat protein